MHTDADAANDDACLDAFIQRFAERALRRAVTPDDVAFYRGVAGAAPFDAADYADVIALLMNSPYFLFFVEHGADGQPGAQVSLDPYEVASRLSYHFWQTMPDPELLDAARSGSILTEEGYASEVERVFADDRTRDAIRTFYGEWFYQPELDELDSRLGTPVFDTFRGDFTPGPDLREHMLDEVTAMATYYSIDSEGTLADLYTSTQVVRRG